MDEIKHEYPNFQFSFGKGLGLVCTGKKVPVEFLDFMKTATNDAFLHQLFNALGSRWRLKNEYEQYEKDSRENIRQLTNKVQHLENQLALKEAYIENLKTKPESPPLQNIAVNQARPSIRERLHNKINTWRAMRKIQKCGLFDSGFYLRNYPDVAKSGMNPARHYLLYGGFEGRKPAEKFDSSFYLEQNPDVKASGLNPLLHFILHGMKEGRNSPTNVE
jgi:hypothetical protein